MSEDAQPPKDAPKRDLRDIPEDAPYGYLKCNWCDYRDKQGERGSVWRLLAHCADAHPVEWAEVARKTREDNLRREAEAAKQQSESEPKPEP